MPDSKKLFFIPIIAGALKSADPEKAMKNAFDEITNHGRLPGYKDGYEQFLAFIHYATAPSVEDFEDDVRHLTDAIYRLMYDLASGDFDGTDQQKEEMISLLKKYPRWSAEFERITEMIDDLEVSAPEMGIEVLKEDQVIGTLPVSEMFATLRQVRPGRYSIRLTTGRIVWQGRIHREDLIWAYVYPGKDLAIAAETKPGKQKPTKIVSLLGGELEMRVFAGLESGEVNICVKDG